MKKLAYLLALFVLLASGLFVLEATRAVQPKPTALLLEEAAQRTALCFEAVGVERAKRGEKPDPLHDPAATWMIGAELTPITTTLGNLEAKRTSTNPNLAAVITDMLLEVGVEAGDVVAVNLSGSFPAANIALVCALDTLRAQGIILSSVGASTYGATDPALTWLDMEYLLYSQGLISQKSYAFSLGGEGDLGLEMPAGVRAEITTRLTGLGYALLEEEDAEKNITARYSLYGEYGAVKCFVNVGGNLAAFGTGSTMDSTLFGILQTLPVGEAGNGLIQRFLSVGVPVVQLLNLKGLATAYGLPVDPAPTPPPGQGGVYYHRAYNAGVLGAVLAATGLFLAAGLAARLHKKR